MSRFGGFVPVNDRIPGLLGAVLLYALVTGLALFATASLAWLVRLLANVMWGEDAW